MYVVTVFLAGRLMTQYNMYTCTILAVQYYYIIVNDMCTACSRQRSVAAQGVLAKETTKCAAFLTQLPI